MCLCPATLAQAYASLPAVLAAHSQYLALLRLAKLRLKAGKAARIPAPRIAIVSGCAWGQARYIVGNVRKGYAVTL